MITGKCNSQEELSVITNMAPTNSNLIPVAELEKSPVVTIALRITNKALFRIITIKILPENFNLKKVNNIQRLY